MDVELGRLAHVDPRELWTSEPGEFTPWLARNISLLGEAIGIDLEAVKVEKGVGDFSCDIHAQDTGRDRPVIIENQLEQTDHRHLGQLLTYAAGLDAAVIVWISPRVRDEHREALDWLNRHTDERIEFFGISLEAVRIDESRPAVQFRLVASPNAWSKTVAATNSGEISEKRAKYQEFLQLVIDDLRENHRFTNARAAQPQSWYAFASGFRGISYNAAFGSGARLRAEVYIDTKDAVRNKAIFDFIHSRALELEKATGPLEWERLDDRRASRISLVRAATTIEDACARSDEVRAWIVSSLLKLRENIGSILTDMPQ